MSEYIEVGQPLQFTDPNTPTRVGEIVESVSDIYNILSPRLGMQVFVKSEKKSFVITSLKSKVINGVDVPEAAVEAFEAVGAKSITWNNDTDPSNMNDFTIAGVYDIKGERTRANDNLPVLNTGGGHSFNARLTVLDSSISGSGKDDDKCITQVLSFSNRLGQGEVYIRTGKGSSLDNLTWDKWSTLQRNVNVGSLESKEDLRNYIDNGIYSGVFRYGSSNNDLRTFVMVVINDYAIGLSPRRVSQFLYSIDKATGKVSYETQTCEDETWKGWEILNKGEIDSMISVAVDNAIKGIIADAPEAFDTLKEIADWIANDKTGAVALANAISANTKAINTEATRATEAEEEISQNAIAADSMGYSTTTDDMSLEFETLNGKSSGSVTFPSATTKSAGVMSAGDKKNLDNVPSTIKDAIAKEKAALVNGDTIVGQAREIHSRNGKTVADSFLARTTAGSGTIGDGVASLKSVGGNIVKNLVDATDITKWGSYSDEFFYKDGVFVARSSDLSTNQFISKGVLKISGHIYYQSCYVYCTQSTNLFLSPSSGYRPWYTIKERGKWVYVSLRVAITTNIESDNAYMLRAQNSTDLFMAKPLLIDLTEMFGAGNEPDKATCDKLFGNMDALPQGLNFAKPTTFTSTGFNQFNPDNVLEGKAIVDNAIVSGDKKIAVIPCLPCKVGVGENNGYCIHGEFGEDIKVYLTPLNPMEVDGELYMHELTKDATTDTYVPLIKGYLLVEVPTTANLCAHFLWSEDKCERDSYEPYFESKIELPTIPEMPEYGLAGIQSSGTLACDEIDFERGVYVKRIGRVDIGTMTWHIVTVKTPDETSTYSMFQSYALNGKFLKPKQGENANGMVEGYTPIPSKPYATQEVGNRCIMLYHTGYLYIRDDAYASVAAFNTAMQGVYLYYELAEPEEYPLPKVDNNYISSDYGVEQFDSVVPCNANNLYYMRSLAGETRNFLDRMYDNTAKADAKEVADYITNGIEGNKELATNAPNLALRALFVAAGAEYNDSGTDKAKTAPWGETVTHKAGYYYLNGLGDITEEQMKDIYNAPHRIAPQSYAGNSCRTFIIGRGTGSIGFPNLAGTFAQAYNMEVLGDGLPYVVSSGTCDYMFKGCSNLKHIVFNVFSLAYATSNKEMFTECRSLITCKFRRLKMSHSFKDSPLISKESVLYIIQEAAPTSAIVITLHPDAYARLADDADIVAALTAQPLVTLVSA